MGVLPPTLLKLNSRYDFTHQDATRRPVSMVKRMFHCETRNGSVLLRNGAKPDELRGFYDGMTVGTTVALSW